MKLLNKNNIISTYSIIATIKLDKEKSIYRDSNRNSFLKT